MCGVYGFVARGNHDPDLVQLKRITKTTMSRGPHAFGFAWLDHQGRLKSYKQEGRIVDHLGLLNMARDARLLIGHCRFATHGSVRDNINNHPHPVDGGWLVHNGMINEYRDIVKYRGLFMNSQCDSEVLSLLFEQASGSLVDRTRAAVNTTKRSPLVMLGLWKHPRRLIAVRRGNPLFMGEEQHGYYLGSLSDDLPGDVFELGDDWVFEFHSGRGAGFESYNLKTGQAWT